MEYYKISKIPSLQDYVFDQRFQKFRRLTIILAIPQIPRSKPRSLLTDALTPEHLAQGICQASLSLDGGYRYQPFRESY